MPAVKVFGLTIICVAAHQDVSETGLSQFSQDDVTFCRRAFVRRTIAGPVHDSQRLVCLTQCEQQRVP